MWPSVSHHIEKLENLVFVAPESKVTVVRRFLFFKDCSSLSPTLPIPTPNPCPPPVVLLRTHKIVDCLKLSQKHIHNTPIFCSPG